MNRQYYTYFGCSCSIEHDISAIEGGAPKSVATAGADLAAIRIALHHISTSDNSEEAFKDHFEAHLGVMIKSIETIRKSGSYRSLDQRLTDLLDNFYDLANFIMNGDTEVPWPSSSTSFWN
ncbi:hypothetical protein V2O64_12075 [Verrucomicrobiaceae bacterium 227]